MHPSQRHGFYNDFARGDLGCSILAVGMRTLGLKTTSGKTSTQMLAKHTTRHP